MAERELFQIGEVAKMYHLSVGTLRHYEQVGLLKPEYTDPATGYRYYSVRQFEQLTNIRYLRALGLPLDEIAATLHDRDVDNIAEALRRQKELIARKKQELEIMERKIDHRLAQLAQFLAANGLQIAGFSREITLIDNCISDDPAQYVTEIRIPVARG